MGLEDYTIVRRIGEGGSGLTYLARDTSGIEKCIKEFRFGMKKGDEETFKARELFEREAQTLEGLNHPQIPRYLDFFVGGDNGEERLYLVMEFVPGKTLDEILRKKRFTEEEAISVAKKVGNILEYLHSFSPPVVHRDIKPKNLIQTPEGAIKLLDFGSVADKVMQATRFTSTRVGSFGFMAPELMYGRPVPSSDIYSLGATLVSLLSGGADPINLMDNNHRLDFKGKLNVSKRTENLLWDMTEPDLNLRIQNIEDLRKRLYGNGNSLSQAFRTNDEITIHYDEIKRNYKRMFYRRWDLNSILNKMNTIFSGVREVVNDYGREFITTPIEIEIDYNGKRVITSSLGEAFSILPKKSHQKDGLIKVKSEFSTHDEMVQGNIKYGTYKVVKKGAYGPYHSDETVVQSTLTINGFTEKNREEYQRLYEVIHS